MKQLFISHCIWVLLVVSVLCGCSPRPEKTIENLKDIVVCQHNASSRYLAFSIQAENENFRNVSNFLEAIACSEKIHAKHILDILNQYGETVDVMIDSIPMVGLTLENLNMSSQVQVYEIETLLPIYISEADTEKAVEISSFLHLMTDVSQRQSDLCLDVLLKLTLFSSDWNVVNSWSVCPICGYLYRTAALKNCCDLCKESASTFVLFQ